MAPAAAAAVIDAKEESAIPSGLTHLADAARLTLARLQGAAPRETVEIVIGVGDDARRREGHGHAMRRSRASNRYDDA